MQHLPVHISERDKLKLAQRATQQDKILSWPSYAVSLCNFLLNIFQCQLGMLLTPILNSEVDT